MRLGLRRPRSDDRTVPTLLLPQRRLVLAALAVTAVLAATACAPGDPRYTVETPAGFWAGLWHGMIALVTLVIGIFSDSVHFYETDNTGGWYDLGFLIGVTMVWGSSHRTYGRQLRRQPHVHEIDPEWEEIGRKVEAKLKRKIRQWAEAEPDENWDVVEERAQAKLKQRFRQWAEEPDEPSEPTVQPTMQP